MSETRLIGSGTVRDVQWTLEAGGDDDGYWTGLEVSGPGDYLCSGGMAGPKLWGDDLICTYTGRSGEGPLGIVVRARPAVRNVLIRTGAGDESELLACGQGIVDGLRFYAGLPGRSRPQASSVCTSYAPMTKMATYWRRRICRSGTACGIARTRPVASGVPPGRHGR